MHYPEYDPIYQLIPPGIRRDLTEEANREWPTYDSEQSEHSDDPPRDLRDEYPEHFEEVEQDEYRRYRLRGGAKRFRPSDIGDEDIYRALNLPLPNGATDGCYLDDHEHLSPSVDRLISWDYRQSIRPWYNNLSPPPTNLAELEQRWLLNWSQTHDRGSATSDLEPPAQKPMTVDTRTQSPKESGPEEVPSPTTQVPRPHIGNWLKRTLAQHHDNPGQDYAHARLEYPTPTDRSYKTFPLSCERSIQTPRVNVTDKGTLARKPPGKPKWTQYYASHCHPLSPSPRPDSPVDDKYTCTCPTGSTHCQCQRS